MKTQWIIAASASFFASTVMMTARAGDDQPQPPSKAEIKQRIAGLVKQIRAREQRAAELTNDMLVLDVRTEQRVSGIIQSLEGMEDSRETRDSVANLKRKAMGSLRKCTKHYEANRTAVGAELRKKDPRVTREELFVDVGRFDERIEKRIDQIVRLTIAMIHRPLFPGTTPDETMKCRWPRQVDIQRESIWIVHSFCPIDRPCGQNRHHLCRFESHRRLASPVASWERLKIGGGAAPVLTRHGWLLVYHGVSGSRATTGVSYHAGVMVLDAKQPHLIRYRSSVPLMSPDSEEETRGAVDNVVFPTGLDQRKDLGDENRFDIYYGMADSRIGVARLTLPDSLPATGDADACDRIC